MTGGYPGQERIVLQPVDESDLFEARVQGFDEVQGDEPSPFRFLVVKPSKASDDAQLYRIEVVTETDDRSPRVTAIVVESAAERRDRYRVHFDRESVPPIRFVILEPVDPTGDSELYRIEWRED